MQEIKRNETGMIRVTEDYVILPDRSGSYAVARDTHKEPETPEGSRYFRLTYHASIAQAVEAIYKRIISVSVRKGGEQTLPEFINTLKQIDKEFSDDIRTAFHSEFKTRADLEEQINELSHRVEALENKEKQRNL